MLGEFSNSSNSDACFPRTLFELHGAYQAPGASQAPNAYEGRDEPLQPRGSVKYEPYAGAVAYEAKIMILGSIGCIFAGSMNKKKSKTTLKWLKLVDAEELIFPGDAERFCFFSGYRAVAQAMAVMWLDDE